MIQKKFKGQTMMEYIILVALIAIFSIPVVTMLGNVFRDRVVNVANELVNSEGEATSEGDEMVKDARNKVRKRINDFGKQ